MEDRHSDKETGRTDHEGGKTMENSIMKAGCTALSTGIGELGNGVIRFAEGIEGTITNVATIHADVKREISRIETDGKIAIRDIEVRGETEKSRIMSCTELMKNVINSRDMSLEEKKMWAETYRF